MEKERPEFEHSDDNPDWGSGQAKARHQDQIKKSREKIVKEDEGAAKQERINKTAQETLKRLNKLTSKPEQPNLLD